MIIIHGIYRFKQRIIGCRNDFCNACQHEALTEHWRSFNVGHLFWIPLLPLWWHARWLCTRCGKDPRARYTTGRGYYWAGLVAFAFIAAMGWFMPSAEVDTGTVWGIRLVGTAATVGMAIALQKSRIGDPLHTTRRLAVIPLSHDTCHYCGGRLMEMPEIMCPTCGVRVYFE